MALASITLGIYNLGFTFAIGFAIGFGLQVHRVRHFRRKQIKAEQEKLKMQAEMLGMGAYYDSNTNL